MAAPGALTNIGQASDGGSATSASVTLDSGSAYKVAILWITDDHTSDSLTVDTSGWTLLTPVYMSSSPFGLTVAVAYSDAATTDTSVSFSWSTSARYCIFGGSCPDVDFSSDVPTIFTNSATSTTTVTMPSTSWTPTGTDVRVVSSGATIDARKTVSSHPDGDNQTTEDAGGLGDPLAGLCSAGVTASSPYSPGDYVFSGGVPIAAGVTVVLLESSGAVPVDSLVASIPLDVGVEGVLDVPTATVSALSGPLTVDLTANATLDVPAASVDSLTGPLTVDLTVNAGLNVPPPTVPTTAGPLTVDLAVSGVLDVPAASVSTLAGSLAVDFAVGGVLDVPAAAVPQVTGSVPLDVEVGGLLDVPTATVNSVAALLDITVVVGGVLSAPSSGIPTVTAAVPLDVGVAGVLDVPTATIETLSGPLTLDLTVGNVLSVPAASVDSVTSNLTLDVTAGGVLSVPAATVSGVAASVPLLLDLGGVFGGRWGILGYQEVKGTLARRRVLGVEQRETVEG